MTATTSSPSSLTEAGPTSRPIAESVNWARSAAIAGFAFVVLNVVGALAPGSPPASNASAAKIAAYFADHSGAIKAQLLLGAIGIAALMWWLGGLWRLMSRAEGERPRLAIVAAVALASGLTLALVSGIATSTAAIRAESVDTTHLLYTMSLVAVSAAGFGIGLSILATCVLAFRTQFVPRWTGYLGGVAALAFFVGGLGTVTDGSAVNTIAFIAFFVWSVWIVVISALMWNR
jgi:hypothetical protein